jgi:hypothetical protein
LVTARSTCFASGPEDGPVFLFEPSVEEVVGLSFTRKIDICLSGPEEGYSSGPSSPLLVADPVYLDA